MRTDKTELFEKTPVTKAVLSLVVPTVLSQIITVVYNMADTFFYPVLEEDRKVEYQRIMTYKTKAGSHAIY